ncbi:hypothetical protein D3C72_1292250 [compost metagenome]
MRSRQAGEQVRYRNGRGRAKTPVGVFEGCRVLIQDLVEPANNVDSLEIHGSSSWAKDYTICTPEASVSTVIISTSAHRPVIITPISSQPNSSVISSWQIARPW